MDERGGEGRGIGWLARFGAWISRVLWWYLSLSLRGGLAAVVVGVEVSKLLLFYPDNRILDD